VSVAHNPPQKITFELEDGSKLGGRIMAHQWYFDIPGDASISEKNEALGIAYVFRITRIRYDQGHRAPFHLRLKFLTF
jgi:hypothetical protein